MIETRAMKQTKIDAERKKNNEKMTTSYFEALFLHEQVEKFPRCESLIWKDGGCRKMMCSQCKCLFCFKCKAIGNCSCLGAVGHGHLDNVTFDVVFE